jgi:thiosulfate reductase cytochrome b subunit
LVRFTHWLTTLCFAALLVSGAAILLAHPRLYWGETGAFGSPSLVDLPLPTVLTGQTGWGRSLHFLAAWLLVAAGLVYLVSGLFTRHFERRLMPRREELAWTAVRSALSDHLHFRRPAEDEALRYNVLQQMAYLAVVFGLFPIMIWTGLAMSPAMTSVLPALVTLLGGQQSARTIHFAVTCLIVLFLLVHVAMVAVYRRSLKLEG